MGASFELLAAPSETQPPGQPYGCLVILELDHSSEACFGGDFSSACRVHLPSVAAISLLDSPRVDELVHV